MGYSYQFPEHFEQKLKKLLDDNNEKELSKLLNSCNIDHQDIGWAHYAGLKENTWNKHALDFTIKVNNEERKKQLKHKQELLKKFIEIILSPNETGFLVRNIDFIIDSSIDNISLPQNDDDNLQVLNEEIKEKLAHNQPELILDRLHTFATRYLRKICTKYQIDTINKSNGDNLPLHSLIGSLVRKYEQQNCLSEFSTNALKNSISIFEKYNTIRNDQSYAHDNEEILNKNEAQFVVTVIINLLNFIDSIENNQSYTSLFYSPE